METLKKSTLILFCLLLLSSCVAVKVNGIVVRQAPHVDKREAKVYLVSAVAAFAAVTHFKKDK